MDQKQSGDQEHVGCSSALVWLKQRGLWAKRPATFCSGKKLMDEPDDITCSVIDFTNCAGEWEAGWAVKLWGNWVIEVDMGGWRHYNRLNPAKFRLAAA
jgi:hypothetical protein